MSDLIKNCIICVSGLAIIGCFITINKMEDNHKLYVKNITLETRLSKLEDKNNKLINKIDNLQEEIVIIKNLLGEKKIIIEHNKVLLEQINNSLLTDLYKTNLSNSESKHSILSNESNLSESGINIKLEDIYNSDTLVNIQYTGKDVIKDIETFNSDEENDCYDYIPMSNVKKITGIKSWFY